MTLPQFGQRIDRQSPTDEESRVPVVIDFVHHQGHNGLIFQGSYATVSETDGEIGDNDNLDFLISVGDQDVHVIWRLACGGTSQQFLYENPTVSDNGTEIELNCMNRDRINIKPATMFHTPTITDVGDLLSQALVPGGEGGNAEGNISRQQTEWILAPNSLYLVRVTNRAGNAQPAGGIFTLYGL